MEGHPRDGRVVEQGKAGRQQSRAERGSRAIAESESERLSEWAVTDERLGASVALLVHAEAQWAARATV